MSVANNQYSESSMSVANRVINNPIQVPTDTFAVANSVQQPLLLPEWAMTRFPGGGGGGWMYKPSEFGCSTCERLRLWTREYATFHSFQLWTECAAIGP